MKQFQNTAIFLLFFLLFLLKDPIVKFVRTKEELPVDSTLEISYQNLLERYRKMNQYLSLLPEDEETHIHSRILFRDPFEFFGQLTLEKGAQDNISINAAVTYDNKLLGIIISTTDHTSKVRLLTSTDSHISVKLKDAYGILETNAQKEQWIHHLTKEIKIEIGDPITTSGLTETPGNIPIGIVEEIEKDELGLIQSVKVKLAADFNEIGIVTILHQKREP